MRSILFLLVILMIPPVLSAGVFTGTITNWQESGPAQSFGDGTTSMSIWWSYNVVGSSGWFYGSFYSALYEGAYKMLNVNVASAPGVTDISQITDASAYTFTNMWVGPIWDQDSAADGVGDFVVYKSLTTGHYGVIRVDSIHGENGNLLDLTWWYQNDGTGNFQQQGPVVPEPGAMLPLAAGLIVLARFVRRPRR